MDADAGHRKCYGTYPSYRNGEMFILSVVLLVGTRYPRRNRLVWVSIIGSSSDVGKWRVLRFG